MFKISHTFQSLRFCEHGSVWISTIRALSTTAESEVKKESTLKRWCMFWKLLLRDYRDVFFETNKNIKEHPIKSVIFLSSIIFAEICCLLNPDDIHYRETILKKSNELIFVSKSIRNPNADEYLRTIESYFNTGEIGRISFGIFSVIYQNYKCRHSALYKDTCTYIQPTYLQFVRDNIIDIGFWNKWWFFEKAMKDYDISPSEWKEQESSS